MEQVKQTATEWFFEQLTKVDYNCINKTFLQNNNSLAGYRLRELFEQAKAMEKQQIIDACNYGDFEELGEKYYNETYGGNK
jgi:hypothetical protein